MNVMSSSSWSKPPAVEQNQTFSDSPGKNKTKKTRRWFNRKLNSLSFDGAMNQKGS